MLQCQYTAKGVAVRCDARFWLIALARPGFCRLGTSLARPRSGFLFSIWRLFLWNVFLLARIFDKVWGFCHIFCWPRLRFFSPLASLAIAPIHDISWIGIGSGPWFPCLAFHWLVVGVGISAIAWGFVMSFVSFGFGLSVAIHVWRLWLWLWLWLGCSVWV